MPTRQDVVTRALSYDGLLDGAGYDGPNPFSTETGQPAEAWCGDFVTGIFGEVGMALPPMQDGHAHGFSYCPSAVAFARKAGATRTSWQAQPGDIALFDWNADGVADHTELVVDYDGMALHTIGGNSGASNENHLHGAGGVHRHVWPAPQGIGNSNVLVVVDASKLVNFSAAPAVGTSAAGAPVVVQGPAAPAPAVDRNRVARMQGHLGDVVTGRPLVIDGVWGPATDASVQAVRANQHTIAEQRAVETAADGDWGPYSQATYLTTVRNLQAVFGVGQDGAWGPVTDAAFLAFRSASFNR